MHNTRLTDEKGQSPRDWHWQMMGKSVKLWTKTGSSERFNGRQIAMTKQGWHKQTADDDPYVYTLRLYGPRGNTLRTFYCATLEEVEELDIAFGMIMR
jgi:hypothetical protein